MEKENKIPQTSLPQIKSTTSQQRFSSWNTNNTTPASPGLDKHLSELDELLAEQDDLLTPIDKDTELNLKGKDDEFDFENSDELNKIIGKYETTIYTG